MYACVLGTERGFFEGLCEPSNASAYSYDPPPPPNTKEPEPRQWDSGPKKITSRATVDGVLAWGRGKPQPAHCQSPLARHPRTTLHVEHPSRKASQAGAFLVRIPSLGGHDLMP
jgi:hypothetical protein